MHSKRLIASPNVSKEVAEAARLGSVCLAVLPFLTAYLVSAKIEGWTTIELVLFIVWLVYAVVLTAGLVLGRLKTKYVLLVAWMTINLLLSAPSGDVLNALKWSIATLMTLSPVVIHDMVRAEGVSARSTVARRLAVWITIVFLVLVVLNVYLLGEDPLGARYLASYDPVSKTNASAAPTSGGFIASGGGFQLVYGVVLVLPVLVGVTLDRRLQKSFRWVGLILLGLVFVFLYMANFATALLVGVASVGLALLLCRGLGSLTRILLAVAYLTITVFLLVAPWQSAVRWFANQFPSESLVNIRLTEWTLGSGEGGFGVSDIGLRFQLTSKSIGSFLENPLFGKLYLAHFDFRSDATLVGQHAEWLDALARYGLVGATLLIGFVIVSSVSLYKPFSGSYYGPMLVVTGITFFVLGFLNPVLETSALLFLFLWAPSVIRSIEKEVVDKREVL